MNKTRTMYLVLIGAVFGFVLLGLTATVAKAETPHRTEFMPCAYEDEFNCVWDAKHQGNGRGHSFFMDRHGKVHYLPHSIAHFLIHGGN